MRLAVVLAAVALGACESSRAALYADELELCTLRAATLAESIACENDVRARYGRPPRALLDAGKDGAP